jgi:hypothetical protein
MGYLGKKYRRAKISMLFGGYSSMAGCCRDGAGACF